MDVSGGKTQPTDFCLCDPITVRFRPGGNSRFMPLNVDPTRTIPGTSLIKAGEANVALFE